VVSAALSPSDLSQLDAAISIFYYIPPLRDAICRQGDLDNGLGFLSLAFIEQRRSQKTVAAMTAIFSDEQRAFLRGDNPSDTASIIWNIIHHAGLRETFFMRGRNELTVDMADYVTNATLSQSLQKNAIRDPRGSFALIRLSKKAGDEHEHHGPEFVPLAAIVRGSDGLYQVIVKSDDSWILYHGTHSTKLQFHRLKIILDAADILMIGKNQELLLNDNYNLINRNLALNATLTFIPLVLFVIVLILCRPSLNTASTRNFLYAEHYASLGYY